MIMTMNDFDDVIFDDEDELTPPDEGSLQIDLEPQQQEEDLTTEVLRLKGISDLSKIKFEEESGAVIERSWDSLSRDEQINILAGQVEEQQLNDLSDEEIELLNTIRDSGMSVNDYLQSLQPEIQLHYDIDSLSDEEVYALDLLEKVGSDNITDEELEAAINAAKQNEVIFKKSVEGLRKEYIKLQQDEEAQKANEVAAQQLAAYNQFATSILNEIRGLNSFAGQELELSSEDSEELAAFMLDLDENGSSAFGRALLDPSLFTKAAFWLLNEDLIVEELTKLMLDNYKRGYEAAKADLQKSKLVFDVKKPAKKESDDFFFDEDDDW